MIAQHEYSVESRTPWGVENPRRGAEYEDVARLFVNAFPIGTVLSPRDFDTWAQKHELLNVPPASTPKDDDAWIAHIQRRGELKAKLTTASTTSRLGPNAFIIVVTKHESKTCDGLWEVRASHVELGLRNTPERVASLFRSEIQMFLHLFRSADWENLSPLARVQAIALYDGLVEAQENHNLMMLQMHRRINRYKHESGIPDSSWIPMLPDETADE